MPKLIICRDGRDYRIVEFSDDLAIGRDPDNSVVLDSPRVSRRHAAVVRDNGALVLVDRDSTNGTWVGRERISSFPLATGLSFRIADYSLTFVDDEPQDLPVLAGSGQERQAGIRDDRTLFFGPGDASVPADLPAAAREGTGAPVAAAPLAPLFAVLRELEDEEELLALLLRSGLEACGAERGFVALLDAGRQLVFRQSMGIEPGRGQEIRDDIVRRVMEQGLHMARPGGPGQGGVVCSPIFCAGRQPEGCLYCDAEQGLSRDGCQSLELLALHGGVLLDRLRQRQRLALEEQGLRTRLAEQEETIVQSPAMLKLYQDIRTIAPINVPVLILGEAGSGKELVASALHSFSNRKGAFLSLNCAAIPEGIFESELFGSVRGAFHEAVDKPGKLEQAHGGTLFLDEIGDMGLALQPKLLRFLENGEVTRLGDTRVRRLDVRIVAATNQDLEAMVGEKRFRDDFFQRLSCFVLKVPPLRDRQEDIEPLARYFLRRFAAEYNWPQPDITAGAMEVLAGSSWPGNVRQLRNVILRLSVQCRGRRITEQDLAGIPGLAGSARQQRLDSFASLEEMERLHIRSALERARGNMSDCARMLGIARSTLYQKMKKYRLQARD